MFKTIFNTMLIVLVFSLAACATNVIDETIPLSSEFEANSEMITFNESFWKIGSKQYNQALGTYFVENAKVHWKKSREQLSDSEVEFNLVNYLLFDEDLALIKEKFDVDNTQQYSFELVQNKQAVANSNCEIFSHSLKENILSKNDSDDDYSEDSVVQNRLETYVFCVIEHREQLWELSLFTAQDEPLEIQLETENEFYEVKPVSEQIVLKQGDSGIEKVKLPGWISKHSGLEYFDNDEKIAALSFVGKPKIWLQDNLTDYQKELLLAVNYSLSMFNWLDQEWRESYP